MGYWEDEFPQQVARERRRNGWWSIQTGSLISGAAIVVTAAQTLHVMDMGGGRVLVPVGFVVAGLVVVGHARRVRDNLNAFHPIRPRRQAAQYPVRRRPS